MQRAAAQRGAGWTPADAQFSVPQAKNCTMSAGDPAPWAHELCQFEVDWQPAGPFTTAQYSFFIPPSRYEATVAWTMKHRRGLDILVHPNSGCENEDHTDWALWAGNKWEVDVSKFSCDYPGCIPP